MLISESWAESESLELGNIIGSEYIISDSPQGIIEIKMNGTVIYLD
jgi:hypothetical protein